MESNSPKTGMYNRNRDRKQRCNPIHSWFIYFLPNDLLLLLMFQLIFQSNQAFRYN